MMADHSTGSVVIRIFLASRLRHRGISGPYNKGLIRLASFRALSASGLSGSIWTTRIYDP